MTIPKTKLAGRALIVALCAGVTFGCVTGDVAVSQDRLANIKKVAVVAMEPPPVTLPRNVPLWKLDPASVRTLTELQGLAQIPHTGAQTGLRAMVLATGIFALGQTAAEEQAAQANYERMAKTSVPMETALTLSADQTWLPTVVVAKEVARRLEGEPNLIVTLKKGIASLPFSGVVDRRQYLNRAIWAWYNSDHSSFTYSNMVSDGVDAVLEVGLINQIAAGYSTKGYYTKIGGPHVFSLLIFLRLVDAKSGEVIGRAREHAAPYGPDPTSKLFANEGRPFKKLFADLTNQLVPPTLIDVGLLKKN